MSDPIFGRWLVKSERAVIEFAPCAENATRACGRIVWMAAPRAEDGALKRDAVNPDPALRDRPICGLRIVSGLKRANVGEWVRGEIYDALRGARFDVEARIVGPRKLKVRGYVLVGLFGRSQVWTRPTKPEHLQGGCDA
ncbi:MAG: DUF2147 domain-containing protein [Pseudomonadota bacterium]